MRESRSAPIAYVRLFTVVVAIILGIGSMIGYGYIHETGNRSLLVGYCIAAATGISCVFVSLYRVGFSLSEPSKLD